MCVGVGEGANAQLVTCCSGRRSFNKQQLERGAAVIVAGTPRFQDNSWRPVVKEMNQFNVFFGAEGFEAACTRVGASTWTLRLRKPAQLRHLRGGLVCMRLGRR